MNNINQINPNNKMMIYFLRQINKKLFQKLFSTKFVKQIIYILWGSKIWAHDLGPGTTFHQQYARGEEITEDRCD